MFFAAVLQEETAGHLWRRYHLLNDQVVLISVLSMAALVLELVGSIFAEYDLNE